MINKNWLEESKGWQSKKQPRRIASYFFLIWRQIHQIWWMFWNRPCHSDFKSVNECQKAIQENCFIFFSDLKTNTSNMMDVWNRPCHSDFKSVNDCIPSYKLFLKIGNCEEKTMYNKNYNRAIDKYQIFIFVLFPLDKWL